MPSREKRIRRRQRGARVLTAMIVITALAALALALVLLNSDPLRPDAPEAELYAGALTSAPPAASPTPAPQVEASPAPQVEAAQATAEAPDEGAAEVEEDGAADELSLSERLTPTAMPAEHFLPVYDRALRTADDEAMIAITVDDCDDAEAMSQILNIAEVYGAKLTLFPTGEALMTEGMTEGFRSCVLDMGHELENRGFAGKAEYKLSDGELAIELWKQSIAASYAVGVDYQQHFYRPDSIYSVNDQRTHFYIRKLNYLGVAGYTYSYRGMDAEALIATLESGNVYQFDMSEASMAVFESFIAEASRKGYRLATMNELFGLEENALSDQLTIDVQELPELNDYEPSFYDLKLNDRTRAVYELQADLIALGYMSGEDAKADGIYGPSTSVAVSIFQAEIGVPATGNATAETQAALSAAASGR